MMMRRVWKHWRPFAVTLVVAAILVAALWPSPVEVDVATVTRGRLVVTVDDEGETRVKDRFSITAPVAGIVERIEWEPGDPVQRDRSVLARIRPAAPSLIDARARAELRAMVEAAEAALGQARAEHQRATVAFERARSSLERLRSLLGVGGVSRDEVEEAEAIVRQREEARRSADFTVQRAEYELQTARARLQQPSGGDGRTIEVRSPVDGVVLRRVRESAGLVQAGVPLLEVGDPARLEVVADFLSTDAVRIAAGDQVLLEQWGGGQELAGRVQRVEPSGFMKVSALGVEEQRVNIVIDFEQPAAAARLGDGYRVEARVIVSDQASVVKVPVSALFRRGEDWAVYVVENGKASSRVARIGSRNDRDAEVSGGLREGDVVVIHPPDSLSDGMRVIGRAR